MQGFDNNLCMGFFNKWNATHAGFTPASNLADFLNDEEIGLVGAIEARDFNPAQVAPQNFQDVQKIFAAYDVTNQAAGGQVPALALTDQEADLVLNIYRRRFVVGIEQAPVDCHSIEALFKVPDADVPTQKVEVNMNSLAGALDSDDDEDGEPAPVEASPFTGGFAPGQPLATPFGQQPPATPFGQQPTTPLVSPFGQQPPTTPSLFGGAPSVFGGAPTQPNMPEEQGQIGVDLPYVAVKISGFSKPASVLGKDEAGQDILGKDVARSVVMKLDDPKISATPIFIEIFLTAGELPKQLFLTEFNHEFSKGKSFNAQKSVIHKQNEEVMLAPRQPGITALSNGLAPKAVCASFARGYAVNWNQKEQSFQCPEGSVQKPTSVRLLESPPTSSVFGGVAQPTGSVFGGAPAAAGPFSNSPFGGGLAPATFTPAAGTPAFGTPLPSALPVQQQSQYGPGNYRQVAPVTVPPPFGPDMGQNPPPGTVQYMVPNFDQVYKKPSSGVDNNALKVAYRVPGGPVPIAVAAGQYWYELPGGSGISQVVQSAHAYLPLDATKWSAIRANAKKQMETFPPIQQWMLQNYGPGYQNIAGQSFVAVSKTKASSGRRATPTINANASFGAAAPWTNMGGPATMGGAFGMQQPPQQMGQSPFGMPQQQAPFSQQQPQQPPFGQSPFGAPQQQHPFSQQQQQPQQQMGQTPFNQQQASQVQQPFGQQQPTGAFGTAFNSVAPSQQAPAGNPFGGQSVPQQQQQFQQVAAQQTPFGQPQLGAFGTPAANPFGGPSVQQQASVNPLGGNAIPATGQMVTAQQAQQQQTPFTQQQQQPPQQTPFGQQQTPFGQQVASQPNPFGQQQTPFGQQVAPQQSPFGQQPAPQTNAFGQQPPL